MPSEQIPEPWASFLSQVDDHLSETSNFIVSAALS